MNRCMIAGWCVRAVGAAAVLLAAAGMPHSAFGQGAVVIVRPAVPMPASQPAEPAGDEEMDEGGMGEEPPPEGDAAMNPEGAAAVAAPGLTPEETAALKARHDALPLDEQEEMRAYYKDLGIDLDAILGISAAANEAAMRLQETLGAMRDMDFSRTPQNVLSARARIGFGQVPHPNPATARGTDIARWIHLQVMAGEWGVFAKYLSERPAADADRIYSQVLQSLNRGNSGLLPEEVLAFAEACPTNEPKPWQVTAWAAMLKQAAAKNSAGPMLAQVRAGTRLFGGNEPAKRRRTVELLSGGGLLAEAYEFLPPLEEARAAGDGELVLVHAKYTADLASKEGDGPESDELLSRAWGLFSEVSLMDKTPLAARRDAIRQAVTLMTRVPRAQVTPWLRLVFADDSLGPAALETIALSAVAVGDARQQGGGSDGKRAEAILALKEAVDVLLEREDLDQSALRVPMRMLTTALVSEMEAAVQQKGRQKGVSVEAQMLLRAIPGKKWLDALEPSLAARAGNACVGIATIADETDLALTLLADAVKRSPDQSTVIANAFLKTWEGRLAPSNTVNDEMMMFYFWREYIAQAPLTRGRQRRNLDRLERLLTTLEATGVEARALPGVAPVFKACHGITEVYDRADIERVFGPLKEIPAATSATLAGTMASSLNGDWRNRAVQNQQGVKRTDTEIAQLVDKGYGLAIELIDSAIARRPDSWRYAVLKASLSYDRLQFRTSQRRGQETAKDMEYTIAAFAAFEEAAKRYAAAVAAGEEREDIGVYARWFGAAMGTSQLNFISADDMPGEGTPQDEQVTRIRDAIQALPPDAAFRHISEFAGAMTAAVSRSDPEAKPRLVKHALRVVGDHPAGASLRALDELYRDLVKNEIRLRIAIDGNDSVGAGKPFGVLLSLRFTNSVDRETGGFAKYLQTNAYVRVGRQYQEVNFRDKLQKNIETTFANGFKVESIGFFDPFMPPRGVVESGQDGWLEKPLAYVVMTRKDAAADRIPQLTMEMQFEDQTGPVTLVLPSNTPPVAVGSADVAARPVQDLKITQIIDPRDARDGEKAKTVTLEVICRGKGAVPDLHEVLAGIDSALPGYSVGEKGIEAKPTLVLQEGDAAQTRYYWGPPKPPEGGYPEPDENGMYRLTVERSWVVTYSPTAGALGKQFTVPTLKPGVQAEVETRYFSDLDLVPVSGGIVPVERPHVLGFVLLIGGLLVAAIIAAYLFFKARRPAPVAAGGFTLPEKITPLSTVMTLRRLAGESGMIDEARKSELEQDIRTIELKYFGRASTDGAHTGNGEDLAETLRRWSGMTPR